MSPDFGPAVGDGPVYAVGLGGSGVANYAGSRAEGGWAAIKILWAASPKYSGPILIRGHQVDGPNDLHFWEEPWPATELTFPAGFGGPGWRSWPSYTRVRSPGCYAWQVDGEGFTEVIVFSAVNGPTARR